MQILPHATPDLFSAVKIPVNNLARDCVFSTAAPGQAEEPLGMHLLLYGAYESTQQNASWHWDPVMYQVGQFDGSEFHAQHAPFRYEASRHWDMHHTVLGTVLVCFIAQYVSRSGVLHCRLDIGDAPYACLLYTSDAADE